MFSLDEFDDSRREFESFFFSHITLIEGQLAQLRTAVEKSAALDSKEKVTLSIMEVCTVTVMVYDPSSWSLSPYLSYDLQLILSQCMPYTVILHAVFILL